MKYRCKTSCWYRSKVWKEGEIADFDGDDVPEHFVKLGEEDATDPEKSKDDGGEDKEALYVKIRQASAFLDHNNNDHWTATGEVRMEFFDVMLPDDKTSRPDIKAALPDLKREQT